MAPSLLGLPPHFLAQELFARLSLLHVVRLRLLCKAWRDCLSSPSFMGAWSRHHASGEHWLVTVPATLNKKNPCLFAYCPSTSTWVTFPVAYSASPSPLHLFPRHCVTHLLAGSAGGLVCTIAWLPRRMRRIKSIAMPDPTTSCFNKSIILVFNPMTGQNKALPIPPPDLLSELRIQTIFGLTITMLAASSVSHYHVILSKHLHGYMQGMLIYDSHTNLWQTIPPLNEDDSMPPPTDQATLLQAQYVFQWDRRKSSLFGYNVHTHEWCKLLSVSPKQHLSSHKIPLTFIHRGRLFMAAPIHSGLVVTGFSVWEFYPCCDSNKASMWVLVAETPNHLYFQPHDVTMFEDEVSSNESPEVSDEESSDDEYFSEMFKLIYSGSHVHLTCKGFPQDIIPFPESRLFHSLMYGLDDRTWSRIPAHPKVGMHFSGVFSYQPSFIATV